MAVHPFPEGKKPHISAIKILAILLVIFGHIRPQGILLFTTTADSPLFPLYLFVAVSCRMAVPLFFMCSGALLLGKEESLGRLYRHRILRYALVLVVFSFLEYLFSLRKDFSAFDLGYFFRTIYSTQIYGYFWFLYTYLGCLMLLPFLRKIARGVKGPEVVYLIVLQVFFDGVLPALEYIFGRGAYRLNPNLRLPLITWGVFFMIVGYWAENIFDVASLRRSRLIGLVLSGAAAIGAGSLMTVYKGGIDGGYSQAESLTFHGNFIAITAVAAFVLLKYIFTRLRISPRMIWAVLRMGDLTFGVYLLHIDVFRLFRPLMPYIQEGIGRFPSAILVAIAVAAVAGALTAVARKVPFVAKFI